MEKFRSTADPSTGVHPFLPSACDSPIFQRALQFLVFLPVRLPAIVGGVLILFAASCVAGILGFVWRVLARPFNRLGHVIGVRLILFGLGVWFLEPPAHERRKIRETTANRRPSHGDLIISNSASYLDPLYLAVYYSPVFVFITENKRYTTANLITALRLTISGNCYTTFKTARDSIAAIAEDSSKACSGPVVLFAEGTTTNGAGVLGFAIEAKDVPSVSTFGFGISYSISRIETYTVGSISRHILRLMSLSRTKIRGKIQYIADVSNMQRAVASLAGVPALRSTRASRQPFETHWAETGSRCHISK